MKRAEAPTYREGRPRVDLIKAAAAKKSGRIICRFFDQDNHSIGDAFIVNWAAGQLELAHHFPDSWVRGDSGITVIKTLLADKKTSSGVLREFFQCPQCSKRVATLAYMSSWACSRCHRLLSRCQVVPKEVRKLERLAEINARIGSVRPTGMRHATFQTLRAERNFLKKELEGTFITASVGHLRMIRGTWITPDEAEFLAHPKYMLWGQEIILRTKAVSGVPQARFDPASLHIPGTSHWSVE